MPKKHNWPRAYTYERGDWLWINQSVPYRLRPLIGRLCWKFSLDTKDPAVAMSKVEAYQKKFDKEFEEAEIRLAYLNLKLPLEEKILEVANHE